jgi:hypothetical protein
MAKQKVTIDWDNDTESPREWCNLGVLGIVDKHGSLIGDKGADPRDIPSDAVHILPVYKYEHGGVAYNTGGFSCPWDSGQVGYIWTTESGIRDCYGSTPPSDEKILQSLRDEVEVFSQWANGDILRFTIHEQDENGEWFYVESCGGFIGTDISKNGILDYLPRECHQLVLDNISYGTGEVVYETDPLEELLDKVKAG